MTDVTESTAGDPVSEEAPAIPESTAESADASASAAVPDTGQDNTPEDTAVPDAGQDDTPEDTAVPDILQSETSEGAVEPEARQEAEPDAPESIAPGSPPEPVDLKKAQKVFSRLGFAAMLVFALGSAGQLLFSSLTPEPLKESWWYIWVATFVPMYFIAIPAAGLLIRAVPVCRAEGERLETGRFLRLIPICVFMMLLGNYMGIGVNLLLERISGSPTVNPVETYAAQDSLWMRILFMAVLAPLMEELLFRRWFIDRMRIYGERLSVVTTALMFALFHGNFSQFFYAFTLGLVFGYVYLRTGRLRYTIALHAFINFIGSILAPTLLAKAGDSVGAVTPWQVAYALYAGLLLLAGAAGLVLLLLRAREIRFEPAEKELPRGSRFRTAWLNPGMGLMTVVFLIVIVIVSIWN